MSETAAQWAEGAVGRLREAGYRDAGLPTICGREAVALRRADFRLQWALTRLHTFVLLSTTHTADADDLRRFVEEGKRWAKKNKGGLPRGLQTGIAVVPVLVANNVTPSAVPAAVERPDKDFAAIGLPMLVDVTAEQLHVYSGTLVWGAVYRMFLGEQQRLIAAGLDGQTFQPDDSVKKSLIVGAVIASAFVAVSLAVLMLLIFT